jgi:hypothetical protein
MSKFLMSELTHRDLVVAGVAHGSMKYGIAGGAASSGSESGSIQKLN